METTTTNYQHPTGAGMTAGMGVNPKHPEYTTSIDPLYVLEESKACMVEWNTTIVPKIMPRLQAIVQEVSELKQQCQQQHNQENVENAKTADPNHVATHSDLKIHFDEAMMIEKEVQTLFDRLHTCKLKIHDALEANPLYTKYLNSIAQLPIFGRRGSVKTDNQITLDHYYQNEFLAQYETATIEYQQALDQCQHILLMISNTRKH